MVFFDVQPLVGSGKNEATTRKGLRRPLLARLWSRGFGSREDAFEVNQTMVRAPPGSFLYELLSELRRECLRSYDA